MDTEDIKEKVAPILRRYPISEAYLFGSTVRKENRSDSDIDILVKFSRMGGLFEFIQIKQELQEALEGRKVDLVQDEAVRKEYRESIDRDKVRIL